jgi:hypothetical protein
VTLCSRVTRKSIFRISHIPSRVSIGKPTILVVITNLECSSPALRLRRCGGGFRSEGREASSRDMIVQRNVIIISWQWVPWGGRRLRHLGWIP